MQAGRGYGDFHHTSLMFCVLIPSELMRNISTLQIYQTSSPYIKPLARKINADLSYSGSSSPQKAINVPSNMWLF